MGSGWADWQIERHETPSGNALLDWLSRKWILNAIVISDKIHVIWDFKLRRSFVNAPKSQSRVQGQIAPKRRQSSVFSGSPLVLLGWASWAHQKTDGSCYLLQFSEINSGLLQKRPLNQQGWPKMISYDANSPHTEWRRLSISVHFKMVIACSCGLQSRPVSNW